jgi:uncharacterized surface protein with fasciclin (FAS1) repeats
MEKSKATIVAVVVAVLLIIGVGIWAFNANNSNEETSEETTSQNTEAAPTQNIVEIASATADLSTLVTAVQAAGLVETLSGEGPFTVLAPTNAAFEALPEGTLDTLLKPENKEQLSDILTYHVVSGSVMSSDLTNGQKVKTVNGQELTVEITDGNVFFVDAKGGKAQVTTADVKATNGVVHIINAVLLPQ